ncbi:periplasmic heavy metal sensor [Paraburkholderia sp.]|uniref:periplasmic heavy metal sensor n=1 Tax=Paraburkholderia sp. TaxID=1926495 RepID=UPI003D6F1FAD
MNSRSWKVILSVSILLNVFLLGGIAGGAYRWFATHEGVAAVAGAQKNALRFAASDLSPQRQQEFLQALKEARRNGRMFARDAREGRRDVLELLAQPQLDRPALDAALARTREADSALRARVETGVADFAATLTPDERLHFAQSLREHGQWRLPPARQPAPKASSQ